MNRELEKIGYDEMKTIKVDEQTIIMLRGITGLQNCAYDWWEMSQAIKDIVIELYMNKNKIIYDNQDDC